MERDEFGGFCDVNENLVECLTQYWYFNSNASNCSSFPRPIEEVMNVLPKEIDYLSVGTPQLARRGPQQGKIHC